MQTQLRSWEDDAQNPIQLAGIKVFFVSAPATRTVVAFSKAAPYNEDSLKFALPDDQRFVESITEIVNATENGRRPENLRAMPEDWQVDYAKWLS